MKLHRSRPRQTEGASLVVLIAAAAAMALVPAVARADVLEIGDHGEVQVRGGTGAVGWVGNEEELAPDLPAAALTLVADPVVPASYGAAVRQTSARYGISPSLLAALVGRESAWRAGAVSAKGATGLAQLMPATARMLAVDARDPNAGLDGGAHYLRLMLDRFDGDVERALAAYNAGPARVLRAGGVPAIAETRAYVTAILDRLSPAAALSSQGLTR